MFDVSELKITELQRYVDMSKPGISKYLKSLDNGVTRSNNRIVGAAPEAASAFLNKYASFKFSAPSITLAANLCGGVGKTSSALSLAAALRRVTSRETSPILLIDGDPQGSLSYILTGKPAKDKEPILIDYIEKKASIGDIIHPLNNNVFVIKSNLNSAFLDKILNRPADIKKAMKDFYTDVFQTLGHNTKIFQDHTPQLSNLFASSVSGIHQMKPEVLCNVIIPLRSDDFAIKGSRYIIEEIRELQETYHLAPDKIRIHSFFSSLDRRISSSGEALKKAMTDDILKEYLCPVVIRYSSELTKSIMSCSNIFSNQRRNNSTDDYQDLLQYIFN